MTDENKTKTQLIQELNRLRSRLKTQEILKKRYDRLNSELQSREKRFQSVVENINVGLYRNTAGPKGRFIDVNTACARIFGFSSKEEVLKHNVSDLYLNPEDRTKFSQKIKKLGFVRNEEIALKKKDGTPILCSVSAVAVRDEQKNIKFFDGVVEDITVRRQAEEALRQSEAKFRNIIEASPMGMHLYELQAANNLIFIGANPAADRILQVDNSQFVGKTIEEAFPPLADSEVPVRYREAASEGTSWRTDQIVYEDEQIKGAFEVYAFQTSPGRMAAVFLDTTERKRADEEIMASLKEKEVLLQEIHHRVKNNMQIISSLLNLQSSKVKDTEVVGMFQESRDRIRAMALIHEKLYQSKDLAQVNLAQYIESLYLHLYHMYRVDSSAVRFNKHIEDVFLDINTAIPVGLVINELVSNALKHAFPNGSQGEICIELSREMEGKYRLIVKDNGVGLPPGVDIENPDTLGMQLVYDLVAQIGGNIDIDSSDGAAFQVTF